MSKVYRGDRIGEHGCEVYVLDEGRCTPLNPRFDAVNHSPDGFEWGYGGSGPSQLAFAMLADLLGPLPAPAKCPYCESAMVGSSCTEPECKYSFTRDQWEHVGHMYQTFKFDIVAALPNRTWSVTEEQIRAWIKMFEQRLKAKVRQ